MNSPNRDDLSRWLLVVLVLAGIAVRCGLALTQSNSLLRSPSTDPDSYALFAHTLVTAGIYGPDSDQPSAFRPPGYPLLLAPWCLKLPPSANAIFGLHMLLSAGIIVGTVLLAKRLGTGLFAGIAGLIVAFDPLLALQSVMLMSETLFTFLFVLFWLLWLPAFPVTKRPLPAALRMQGSLRRIMLDLRFKTLIPVSDRAPKRRLPQAVAPWLRYGAIAAVLAMSSLTRPIALPTWFVCAIPSWRAGRLREWMSITVILGVLLLPWGLRNALVVGKFTIATTHGGYTLWLGQNPEYYKQVVTGPHDVWPDESFKNWSALNEQVTRGLDEVKKDAVFRTLAVNWIREHPAEAFQTGLHHLQSLWGLMPKVGSVKVKQACLLFYLPVTMLAILGLCDRRLWTGSHLALPLTLLVFSLVHAVYWSNIRMRAPLMPILAVLVSSAIAHHFGKRSRWR